MTSGEWPVASGQWHQWELLCFPRDWATSVGSEEWGVGTVGSGSSGKPKWDQWGVGPVGSRSGISGEWEAGVGLEVSGTRSGCSEEWV